MVKPKVCVLRAPGTNCDVETAFAFETCGAAATRVHLFRVLENPRMLAEYQVLCIPGGFSYGDDIGAGVIFSRQLQGHLAESIGEFLQTDKLILGICNGFQVLLKSGILPSGSKDWPPAQPRRQAATLTWNDNGRYTALWVRLKRLAQQNVFLRGIDEIDLPIAHAEGKLVVEDDAVLDQWFRHDQIALCYSEPGLQRTQCKTQQTGSVTNAAFGVSRQVLPYPVNPNGSIANIAGLGDFTGRVLGMMPHPERFIHMTQHPNWTRLGLSGEGDGMKIFRNAVEYFW